MLIMLLLTLPQATAQRLEEPLLGITVRNSTLERRLTRTRTEQEPVTTNILNSDVQGQQTTTTETRLRILSDSATLRFDVVSTGNVSSQTTGTNRQATIDSTGQHHFEITKPFWFDGKTFLTKPGHGTIRATQAPQRVMSAVGATMPLLRPLSDRLAWEEVARRQPEINQAVALDVSRTVLPKVDRIVDEQFARLGQQWTDIRAKVESTLRDLPLNWVAQSSETSFSIAAIPQNSDVAHIGISSVPVNVPQLADGEEVAFGVSESVATALLAKYVRGGQVLTDTQVERASKIWNDSDGEKWPVASLLQLYRELERNESAEPTLFSIQLAESRPIAIRFDRGDICIDTSFQIIPRVGSPSGWMMTTWRIRGREVSDDEWSVALHQVDVNDLDASIPVADAQKSAQETGRLEFRIPSGKTFESNDTTGTDEKTPDSGSQESQVTTVESGTVWMSVVRNSAQALVKQIPAATLPKEFDLPTSLTDSPKIRIVRIESANGVLRAAFRLVDCQP